jgi:hypothetical protein
MSIPNKIKHQLTWQTGEEVLGEVAEVQVPSLYLISSFARIIKNYMCISQKIPHTIKT